LKKPLGKARVVIAGLTKLSKFVNKEKAPKGFDFRKIMTKILLKGTHRAIADFHFKTLYVGMMHFQDAWNYDLERLQRCCVHYVVPDGRIIPFCAYNALPKYRAEIEEQFAMKAAKETLKKIAVSPVKKEKDSELDKEVEAEPEKPKPKEPEPEQKAKKPKRKLRRKKVKRVQSKL